MDIFENSKKLEPGTPCNHLGCCGHISHPCEGCGRVACGLPIEPLEYAVQQEEGRRRWKEEHLDEVPLYFWESKPCPACERLVNLDSETCYYCGYSFTEGVDGK